MEISARCDEAGLMTDTPNAAQSDFWNSQPGRNWVTFQPDLDLLHGAVTDLLLRVAGPQPGEKVLDVGCGAGAASFAFAKAVGARGRVEGIDISVPLVERATALAEELSTGNVTFSVLDAQVGSLPREAYDLVVSRFGVMFFSDPVAAFRNMAAALRPGGRIVFASWAGPQDNPWFSIPQQAAVERLGPAEASPPDAPGPMAFRDTARVLAILSAAGFADAACAPERVDLHHPGGLESVLKVVSHVGPIARMLRDKNGTDEDRNAILEVIADRLRRYEASDGIRVPALVNVFSASVI